MSARGRRQASRSQAARVAAMATALTVVAAWAGCASLDGLTGGAAPEVDGGLDGVEAAAPPDPCVHQTAPGRPDREDDGGTPLGTLYFALRELRLTPRNDAGEALGLDLDGVCTCESRAGTAHGGASSCVPSGAATDSLCDSDGGVDNQVAVMVQPYEQLGVDLERSADINHHIEIGSAGMVVYLADYNGTNNDREVEMSLLVSNGIVDPSGCPVAVPSYSGPPQRYAPQWCGNDRWTYESSSVVSGTSLPLYVGHGWVNDGVLAFASERMTVLLNGTVVNMSSARTVAKISPTATGYHLDGITSGRIPARDFLGVAAHLPLGDAGPPLCQNVLFSQLKRAVCDSLDLAESEALDFQDKPCGAISFAFAFTADSAALGGELDLADAAAACPDDAGFYACSP